MTQHFTIDAVVSSIEALQGWVKSVNRQATAHLWQFLSLKLTGANTGSFVDHPEQRDFDFCDKFLMVRDGGRPYFDPLVGSFRIASHPHSNIATARKNTFKNRWQAAEVSDDDSNQWRLREGYVEVLRQRMCTRGGEATPVPALALLGWMYRNEVLADEGPEEELLKRFIHDFHLSEEEVSSLLDLDSPTDRLAKDEMFAAGPLDTDALLQSLEGMSLEATVEDPPTKASREAYPVHGLSPQVIAELLYEGKGQLVLVGPPGTGKTHLAKAAAASLIGVDRDSLDTAYFEPAMPPQTHKRDPGYWTLVQFHASYAYEDFIRGISASVDAEGRPVFEVRDGLLARVAIFASGVDAPVVLIVDEINRGDLARVLGEALYGLEYRGECIALQHSTPDGTGLVIPSNLYLIGTMNTADRSLAHLDYAVRRRFDFLKCSPDRGVLETMLKGSVVEQRGLELFDAVTNLMRAAPDHAIGHAYFMHREPRALARSFVFGVLPLLGEYRIEGVLSTDAPASWGITDGAVDIAIDSPTVLVDELEAWLSDEA